jgi:adenylate cyclase
MSETRKLAAILVAEVVGYSRLAGADVDSAPERLRRRRSDVIEPAHRSVIKRTDDGSIIEVRSVVDTARSAIPFRQGDGRV